MEVEQTKEFYDFGAFRLDARNRLLWHKGEPVALALKEFEVLFFLVENAGEVVEKDQLLEAIWKGVYIEEATLAQNISRLRRKLEAKNENGGKIIETLPKRGYRFLPAVQRTSAPAPLVIEEQTLTRVFVEETIESGITNAERKTEARNDDLQIVKIENSPVRKLNPQSRGNPRLLWLAIGALAIAVLGFVVYQIYFQKREPSPIVVSRVVPFSGLPGVESFPAFSPDGKQIAFVWNGGDAGILDVYVKLVGEGEPVRLTKGTASAYCPVFAPDGRRVFFFRSTPAASVIYSVSALGGAERKIAEVQSGGTSFSVSPDGKRIAVADRETENSGRAIFSIDVETGAKNKLTEPPENEQDETPRFSPDGEQIAFVRSVGSGDDKDLYVAPTTKNARTRRLTFDRANVQGLTWTADGAAIVFASWRKTSAGRNLWQVAATGGEPTPILTSAKSPANPAIAPNGGQIAFIEDYEGVNVWRYEIDEGKKSIAAPRIVSHVRSLPQLSPDNKSIVYFSTQTGKRELWIADADGKNQRQLTDSPSLEPGSPRFSPDGRFVAFDAKTNEKTDIYVVSVEGGAPHRLTAANRQNHLPSWSADGNWIYFASNRDETDAPQIWRVAAIGGKTRQITTRGGFDSQTSSDGKEIFYRPNNNSSEIRRVPADGGEEALLVKLSENDGRLSWAASKEGIYFTTGDSPHQIRFYDFAAAQIVDVAQALPTPVFPGLSVSADGKTLLYARRDQNFTSIMLAEIGK